MNSSFPQSFQKNIKQTSIKLKIPDLNTELFKDQKMHYKFDTSLFPPPLSTTSCFIQESTNSDPNLIRSTMYVLPDNPSAYDNLNIPFGVSLTPFSFKSDVRSTTNYSRCYQCLSFSNIYWRQVQDGSPNTYLCNICKFPNNLSNNLNSFSTYEISNGESSLNNNFQLVDSEYFSNIIFKCPAFIFVFDNFLNEDLFRDIKKILEDETFLSLYKRVVFMTSSTIYGYINNNIVEYNILNEPFIPPDVFIKSQDNLEGKRFNSNLNNIFEQIKKCPPGDIKYNILHNLEKYTVGNKVVIFSNKNMQADEKYNYLNNLNYKYSTLKNLCTTESFFNINIEVKTSNGISRNTVYANKEINNILNLEIGNMDTSSTLMYTFYIDEYISDSSVYIQFIIKYYNYEGEYKTKIINQAYKISKNIFEIYNGVSWDTLFSCFCKFIIKTNNVKQVEEMICKYLKYYRKTCCKDISVTQFVLPESTKLLPLLYQALVKNKVFSINHKINKNIIYYSVEQNLRFFYPRLFSLTDYYIEKDLTKIKNIKLSINAIESSEIYVMENSQKIYLYIGKEVDQELREGIFKNEEEYKILEKLVEDINGTYGYELPVVVIEEGKKGDVDFYGYMVEDSLNGVCSYYDYVCELHFKVQSA